MPTPDTYDVLERIAVLIVLPLIIWVNRSGASALHARIWREHTNLMRILVLILALLSVYAACALLADFGVVSPAQDEAVARVIGIAFLISVVALIPLSIAAGLKALRSKASRAPRT